MAVDAFLLPDYFRSSGDNGENGSANVVDGNEIFGAFDDASNISGANAFANFDNAWGEVPADSTAKADGFEEGRSTPRRSRSGKEGEKHRRKPRRRSGGAENSAEGIEVSVDDIHISDQGDKEGSERRSRREDDKRPSAKGTSERRRRPKEGEGEERSTPRRNRSHRESRTTATTSS